MLAFHLATLVLSSGQTLAPDASINELSMTLKSLKADLKQKQEAKSLKNEIAAVKEQIADVAAVKELGSSCLCNGQPLAGWDGQQSSCTRKACGGASSVQFSSSSSTSSSSTTTTTTKGSCFDKATTTACRLTDIYVSAEAAYKACFDEAESDDAARVVLLSDLVTGDRVLTATTDGALAATRVVTNQHAKADEVAAEMLVLHTTAQKMTATLSLTPDHAIYVDGALKAASEAEVGSTLTTADGQTVTITRIGTKTASATIINPVTASGTILANGYVAASHPIWLAPTVTNSLTARLLVNAALLSVGDVTDVPSFAAILVAKAAALVAVSVMVLRKTTAK